MRGRIVAGLALLVIAAALVLALRPHEATAAERVDRITSELRCPVCQGLSVKDSPSETARQVAAVFAGAPVDFVDGAISGPASHLAIRGVMYLSGAAAERVAELFRGLLRVQVPSDLERPTPRQLAELRERVRAEEAADA